MAPEKRLIDADALDDILKDFENRYQKVCFALSAKAIANVRQIVYAMKTVDAVEVVRCKDCKWYAIAPIDNVPYCCHESGYCGEHMGGLFFCACGERRGDE